jgi:hypothetical protein
MTILGHIRNGVIVLDRPSGLPEGAAVEVDVKLVKESNGVVARDVEKLAAGVEYDPDSLERLREASKL